MAVLIGHASLDERGKSKGGLSGDQTGKEVCTRGWYNKDWDVVLRPISSGLADNSARICEMICGNANVGYDQNQRNSLWNAYLRTKRISPIEKVECDCSSLMTYCAILGGANIIHGSNAPTTSNMVEKFVASGSYVVLVDKKYKNSDEYLRRGDILVKRGKHTVMVLSNGLKAYDGEGKKIAVIAKPTLKQNGTKNKTEIRKLQTSINTIFDLNIDVDGGFGQETYNAVYNMQNILKNAKLYNAEVDGSYGPATEKALKTYAKQKGFIVK